MKRVILAVAIAGLVIIASTLSYLLVSQSSAPDPPCVLDYSPKGLGVSIDSTIRVEFCKDMDTDSVERAFYTTPSIAGDYSWENPRTMIFRPMVQLAKGVTYIVTIDDRAKSADGKGLDSSIYRWYFTTEGSSTPGTGLPTRRAVGSDSNDFWITYPSSHPDAGQSVSHPSWAYASLDKGVVMILDHSEGCAPCVQQVAICNSVLSSYPQVQYVDLVSGEDEPQASEAFRAYDPTGGINYIPLTIILTWVKDGSGNVVIGWHSWEGVVDSQTLVSWIIDAISYYSENA
jgi:hypothetical protein